MKANYDTKPFSFKFPTIRHFHDVIKEYNKLGIYKKVKLIGHPKIHGSNANICFHSTGDFTLHSKTNMLDSSATLEGFYNWAHENYEVLMDMGNRLKNDNPKLTYPFVVCGEWAGGKIQGKASTSGLNKFLSLFEIGNVVEETDQQGVLGNHIQFVGLPKFKLTTPDINLYDIRDFGTFEQELDVSFPELVQNVLSETTIAVESECPVASYFGVKSSKGEGVVWHASVNNDRHLYFKVKGHKHTTAKVRTLASVSPEKVNSILEFVEYAVTVNRMEQGVGLTGQICKDNLGPFIKWVVGDVIKEETSVLEANGLEWKAVERRVVSKAMNWYRAQY